MGTVEAILDRAKAAITEFLQLPNRGSQQAPRCKCCERGAGPAYNPEVWTSRRQFLQRHLEVEHGAHIRSTVNICTICEKLPPLPHIAICPSSFLTLRGLMNHEQRHRREAALQARQATMSATPRSPNGFEPPPSSTQGASSAVPSRPAPSPPQSQTPEARSQGGHRESSSE
ncbi:hypothetical protein HPB50_024473 [Hyalomma asiaticum]|uniref:Uncharacterized protein n=1 Tax=Hyalomma asiaticum TaxID=266040 RepID=A0ACB7TBE9_HYAAI|nr:hypothetical protein HPB50_024473 [Hyalomma asiaticum]